MITKAVGHKSKFHICAGDKTILQYINLLYFAWADQRVQRSITTILFEVGSYRTVVG